MSKDYLITENSLISIAEGVRTLTGEENSLSISEIVHTLNNLEVNKNSLPVLNAAYPQDSSLTIIQGQSASASFSVVIDTPGQPAEYTYQWFENGTAIANANSSVYSKTVTTGGTFSYYCEITNKAGTVTSRVATLNVTLYKLPVLNASYPANITQIEKANGSASFSVQIATAGVPTNYTYQWYVNNSAVSGATSSSYTKTGLTSTGTYTVYCKVTNAAGTVQSRTATLTVQSSQPTYTYSGSHELIKEDTYNWKIKLKTSGTLRFSHLGNYSGIDVFCVGGGGGGCSNGSWSGAWGAGGGGGYTETEIVLIDVNTEYTITIGGGGSSGTNSGGNGGNTSAFSMVADGGKGAAGSTGGAGGSGGGGSCVVESGDNRAGKGGNGGSNGGAGTSGTGGYTNYPGGTGQGGTTREFGSTSGTLYAGGGAGTGYMGNGSAGDGGGGAAGAAGATNTGGGGGGRKGNGGSGIVVIRNHR